MIKACIFDLDGTLADTLDSMAYVTNIIMEKFGLKTLPVDNFRYYSGEGANMLIRRALKDAGDPELAHYIGRSCPYPLLGMLHGKAIFYRFKHLYIIIFVSERNTFFRRNMISLLIFSDSFCLVCSKRNKINPLISRSDNNTFFSKSVHPVFHRFFCKAGRFKHRQLHDRIRHLFHAVYKSAFIFYFI